MGMLMKYRNKLKMQRKKELEKDVRAGRRVVKRVKVTLPKKG